MTGTITDAAARLSGRPRHRAARAAQDAGGRAPELRQVLVAAQVAVALVLLATTGLFLRALQQAAGAPTGYDGDRILVMSIDTNHAGQRGAQASALADRLIQRSAG